MGYSSVEAGLPHAARPMSQGIAKRRCRPSTERRARGAGSANQQSRPSTRLTSSPEILNAELMRHIAATVMGCTPSSDINGNAELQTRVAGCDNTHDVEPTARLRAGNTSPVFESVRFPADAEAEKTPAHILNSARLRELTTLWASVAEHGPTWLNETVEAGSKRTRELHGEMRHLAAKQRSERAQIYADCPDFHDYHHHVQLGLLSPTHRRKVFEWNIEIVDMLNLSNQALLLAFAYFDRYLSLVPSRLQDLQLLSLACIWVASKVCSTDCPVARADQLGTLVGGISADDVKRMEWKLLAVLDWRVHPTMPYDIAHLIIPCMSCDHPSLQSRLEQLAESILLTMALVYPMLKYDALVLAAASVACASELVAGIPLKDLGVLRYIVELIGADAQTTEECISMLRDHVRLERLCPKTK